MDNRQKTGKTEISDITSEEAWRRIIIREISRITDLKTLENIFWIIRGTADMEHRRKKEQE